MSRKAPFYLQTILYLFLSGIILSCQMQQDQQTVSTETTKQQRSTVSLRTPDSNAVDSTPPEMEQITNELLSRLLATSWSGSTSTVLHDSTWQIETYGNLSGSEDSGYALRAFSLTDSNSQFKIFSYAVPSLHEMHELILSGLFKVTKLSFDDAVKQQEQYRDTMTSQGYSFSKASSNSYSGWGSAYWKDVYHIANGELRGLMYRNFESSDQGGSWSISIDLKHARFDECNVERTGYGRYGNIRNELLRIPDALIKDLESNQVTDFIPDNQWQKIKVFTLSISNSTAWRRNLIPISDLIEYYEKIDITALSEEIQPQYLLLQNYLINYLFRHHGYENGSPILEPYLPWIQEQNIEYEFPPLGAAYVYKDNLLLRVVEDYKSHYWGQFAFVQLMKQGFDASGTCAQGADQWAVVLEKGKTFLTEYPSSAWIPDVLFFLGKAEETRFSLGLTKNDEYVDWFDYVPYIQESQENAISYYERLLETDQADKYVTHLQYVLPRLRAGISTGEMYYYCIYD